jgi:hypothetical protein
VQVEFYKVRPDRVRFYSPKAEHNSSQSDLPAYGSDARPLRFVDYGTEPSGEFAIFEGNPAHPERVKRIEQDPVLISEMFQKTWDDYAPTGLSLLATIPATENMEISKLYNQFEKAKSTSDIPNQARALSLLLLRRKSWAPISGLPPEIIEATPVAKAESVGPLDIEPKDESTTSFPWLTLGVVALAIGVVTLGSNNGK